MVRETCHPFCVTKMKTNLLAVSIPDEEKIILVPTDERKLKVVSIIITKYKPMAICGLKNGLIAVAWDDPIAFGIFEFNMGVTHKVYLCQDKAGRRLKTFCNIAVDEARSQLFSHALKIWLCTALIFMVIQNLSTRSQN